MTDIHHDKSPNDDAKFHEITAGMFTAGEVAKVQFDQARHELYDQLAEMACELSENPHDQTTKTFSFEGVYTSVCEVVKSILNNDIHMDENVSVLVDTLVEDNVQRTQLIEGLLDGVKFQSLSREQIGVIVRTIMSESKTTDETIDSIASYYLDELKTHFITFAKLLVEKPNEAAHVHGETEQATLEIKKNVKDHALDVAKIAAGVSIALALDKLLGRSH